MYDMSYNITIYFTSILVFFIILYEEQLGTKSVSVIDVMDIGFI